jgi:hypothetical protein
VIDRATIGSAFGVPSSTFVATGAATGAFGTSSWSASAHIEEDLRLDRLLDLRLDRLSIFASTGFSTFASTGFSIFARRASRPSPRQASLTFIQQLVGHGI